MAEAVADPGFVFGLWVGTIMGTSAGVIVTLGGLALLARAAWKVLRPVLGDWVSKAMP